VRLVARWRIRLAPDDGAPFEAEPWEVEIAHISYQVAVVEAGRRLCRSLSGPAANRMWWHVELIELVKDA